MESRAAVNETLNLPLVCVHEEAHHRAAVVNFAVSGGDHARPEFDGRSLSVRQAEEARDQDKSCANAPFHWSIIARRAADCPVCGGDWLSMSPVYRYTRKPLTVAGFANDPTERLRDNTSQLTEFLKVSLTLGLVALYHASDSARQVWQREARLELNSPVEIRYSRVWRSQHEPGDTAIVIGISHPGTQLDGPREVGDGSGNVFGVIPGKASIAVRLSTTRVEDDCEIVVFDSPFKLALGVPDISAVVIGYSGVGS